MKKFAVRLLYFILLPLPLLYGVSYIVDKGLQRSNHVYYAQWNALFNSKINADMIVCGSSRAEQQISPRILDSMLQMTTYNLGMSGTHFPEQYDRLKLYLRYNSKPAYILQTMDFTSFAENNKLANELQYMPYLGRADVNAMMKEYKVEFGPLQRYFPLLKYNNQLPLIMEGTASYFGKGMRANKYKGYEGLARGWDGSFERYIRRVKKPVKIHVSKRSVEQLHAYLELCREQGIKVVIVFPPVYYEFLNYCSNKDYILGLLKDCERQYGTVFLDYSRDELTLKKSNFTNSQHLTRVGAEAFSQKLANDLKPILKQ